MRYEILDSHRTMTDRKRQALAEFFCEVKGIPSENVASQVDFCTWYEREFAVKWFEVIVWDSGAVVGYLRCLRDPADVRRWFIGDVHVRAAYRRRGIAGGMYERTIRELHGFETAETVVSAVGRDNARSIGLHKKYGFHDTGKPCEFANFFAAEDETMYQKQLYQFLPVPGAERAEPRILPLWTEWKKYAGEYRNEDETVKSLRWALQKAEKGEATFEAVWCGARLVGFATDATGERFVYLPEDGRFGK
ncbi:MAG: GNAT family N-acetyltransferase [Lachnospiraceae bacterium]|nr:GNAT family N-acetyltransferase [Lachnospiraceae bacterium]